MTAIAGSIGLVVGQYGAPDPGGAEGIDIFKVVEQRRSGLKMEGHRHLPTRPGRLDAMAAVGYGYPVAMRLQDTTEPAQSRQRGCRVIAPRGGRQQIGSAAGRERRGR